MTRKKVVSVRGELFAITNAVRGANALVEHAEDVGDDEARQLQPAIRGILTLVTCRLRDLERVVHGEVDPELFFAPHNAAGEEAPADDETDVLLSERPPARRERYATELLHSASAERHGRETASTTK